MPLPVELLYRLTDRDAALPQWGFVSGTILAQANSLTVSTDEAEFRASIPRGFLLNLTRVGVHCNPDPAANVTFLSVVVYDNPGPSQNNIVVHDIVPTFTLPPPNGVVVVNTQSVDMVCGRDEFGLSALGGFDALQVNSTRLIYSGYLIPKGNHARF